MAGCVCWLCVPFYLAISVALCFRNILSVSLYDDAKRFRLAGQLDRLSVLAIRFYLQPWPPPYQRTFRIGRVVGSRQRLVCSDTCGDYHIVGILRIEHQRIGVLTADVARLCVGKHSVHIPEELELVAGHECTAIIHLCFECTLTAVVEDRIERHLARVVKLQGKHILHLFLRSEQHGCIVLVLLAARAVNKRQLTHNLLGKVIIRADIAAHHQTACRITCSRVIIRLQVIIVAWCA